MIGADSVANRLILVCHRQLNKSESINAAIPKIVIWLVAMYASHLQVFNLNQRLVNAHKCDLKS